MKHLIEKGILSGINRLLDCDESIKYMASVIVARLTYPEEIEEILLLNGLMSVLQVLFSHVHRTDTLCLLLLRLLSRDCAYSIFIFYLVFVILLLL